jgi:hypothetical protein
LKNGDGDAWKPSKQKGKRVQSAAGLNKWHGSNAVSCNPFMCDQYSFKLLPDLESFPTAQAEHAGVHELI